jgi:hypothetical protein
MGLDGLGWVNEIEPVNNGGGLQAGLTRRIHEKCPKIRPRFGKNCRNPLYADLILSFPSINNFVAKVLLVFSIWFDFPPNL